MLSPTSVDDDAAFGQANDVEQSVSDDAVDRLLTTVLVVLATALVTGLFAAAAIWASGSSRTCSTTTSRRS